MNQDLSRRKFLLTGAALSLAPVAVIAHKSAFAQSGQLDPENAQAAALQYTHESAVAGQNCANCQLYTGAASAEDALVALDEAEFDCVVTDIEMPGMDGLALTRTLRQQPAHADLPVIVVSTLDRPAARLAGLESGADAYLTKQKLDARELVALVRRVGGGR